VSKRIIADRLNLLSLFISEIRLLPLHDKAEFFSERRNIWAAESCLRRSLEALFDAGRHILAACSGRGVTEFKEIAVQLRELGVLNEEEASLMRSLAGYRNRLVHFYHEVSSDELFAICTSQLGDIQRLGAAIREWVRVHPEKCVESL